MKKNNCTYLFIIILAAFHTVNGQVNPSIVNDSTGAWRVNYINDNGSGGSYFNHDHYRYNFNGDTLINGKYYHKLFKGGHSWAEDFFAGESFNHLYYTDVFSGAVREEGHKWFYHSGSDLQPEFLLYDFSLNPGDFLPVTFNNYMTGIVVTVVDTVILNDIPRRRLFIEGYNGPAATCIIEGIGGNTGLIEPLQMFEPIWNLVCYAEDGVSVWNESGGLCDLTVNAGLKPDGSAKGLIVFSDTETDYIQVRIPRMNEHGILAIYDGIGRLCEQISISAGQNEVGFWATDKHRIYLLSFKSVSYSSSIKFIVR
ncbi:MAG: hypothetical protein V1775_02075 [Bacteroidota bacterium]